MVQTTDPWSALARELDAWTDAGRRATLWWRDDDCVAPTPALDRLLALAGATGTPLALAVVPAAAEPGLPRRLEAAAAEGAAEGAAVTVLQHGWSHANHAPPGRKKQELDASRPRAVVLDELARGAARLTELFGPGGAGPVQHLPVLVPPWNRIDPDLTPALGPLGYRGLSTDGPRAAAEAAPGLVRCNIHVDLLRGLRKAGAVDPGQVLADLAGHLAARRTGRADPDEPSGLMTHHLAHDDDAWALLETLLDRLRGHPATRFVDPAEAFAPAAAPVAAPAAARDLAS